MAELADAQDLGDVTSVKIFRVGFDQQLLVQGFPYGKAIYAQIQIRDFIALCALISAGMMELVDMRDLGSRGVIRWGSSPHARTKLKAAFSFWKMQLLAFLKQRL